MNFQKFRNEYFLNLRTSEIHLFYNLQLFYWHFLEFLWLFIFQVFYLSFSFSTWKIKPLRIQILIHESQVVTGYIFLTFACNSLLDSNELISRSLASREWPRLWFLGDILFNFLAPRILKTWHSRSLRQDARNLRILYPKEKTSKISVLCLLLWLQDPLFRGLHLWNSSFLNSRSSKEITSWILFLGNHMNRARRLFPTSWSLPRFIWLTRIHDGYSEDICQPDPG